MATMESDVELVTVTCEMADCDNAGIPITLYAPKGEKAIFCGVCCGGISTAEAGTE